MKDNNYEFRVGDEVETVDGMAGKIVSICHCERCAERGFFEPRWETLDGKYSDYITVNQANWGFPYYRRIGKYVWNHDANEEKSTKNIFKKENEKMKEIKLTIDGEEVQLTEEQLKVLGIEIEEKRKNPFDRVAKGEVYSLVGAYGYAVSCHDDRLPCDNNSFLCHNYFNDKAFANQVALHQLLYRKLLKFAYDNDCEDTAEWNGYSYHFYIRYEYNDGVDESALNVAATVMNKSVNEVYFSSNDTAFRAIREVIEPFMKEHPEFVW